MGRGNNKHYMNPPHRKTSIGKSPNTKVKHKQKRRMRKPNRGQGK